MAEQRTFEVAALRQASGLQEFVEFWSARYSNEAGEEFYWNEAQWPEDDEDADAIWEHFENLLRWKEQARFRKGALESARQHRAELLENMMSLRAVQDWTDRDVSDGLLKARKALNTSDDRIVRPVLVCHFARPEQFPLYDQHVWRAWGRIAGWLEKKHLAMRPTTAKSYAEYRDFALGLAKELGGSREDLRRVDKALMAFGQFLVGEGEAMWAEDY